MNTRYLSLRGKIHDAMFRTGVGRRILVGRSLDLPREAPAENGVLKREKDWRDALEEVVRLGLPHHPDLPKNWDSLAALSCILKRTGRGAVILDAGSELYSVILPWLCLYGYHHLRGINLVFDSVIRRGPIIYEYGDITATRFQDEVFDAVTCLSVIEHGVDVTAYFREMSRVLKPKGLLITSVDYFESPIDAKGKEAYGGPVHIFSGEEVLGALRIANAHGFVATGPLDLSCEERPVTWSRVGLQYTFLVFAMAKV
jgi:SAM-dependent methyltransferase